MKSLHLNDNGDIEFDNLGNLKMVEGADEVRQRNKISLSTRKGEWFLNLNFGIPWLKLLGNKAKEDEIKQEIVKTLESDDAIGSINSIEINTDNATRDAVIDISGTLTTGDDFKQSVEI